MPYEGPSFQDLTAFASSSVELFQTGSQKLQTLTALFSFMVLKHTDQLGPIMGLLVFAFEKAYDNISDWDEGYGWCQWHGLIEKELKISLTNPLPDTQRLVYLFEFYTYVQTTLPAENTLGNDILKVLKGVRNRDTEEVDRLLKGAPNLEALREYIEELPAKYKEATKNRWFTNKDRENTLQFIQSIHSSLLVATPQNELDNKNEEKERDIRLGLVLFVLMYINEQYKCFSPQGNLLMSGSQLFKDCLLLLNVNGLEELRYTQKIHWLEALYSHSLQYFYPVQSIFSVQQKIGTEIEHNFTSKIKEYIKDQKQKKLAASNPLDLRPIRGVASNAVQTGVPVAAHFYMGAYALSFFTPYVGVSAMVTLPLHFVLFFSGRELSHKVYGLLNRNAISRPVLQLYTTLLKGAGNFLGRAITSPIEYTFSPTPDGFRKLESCLGPKDTQLFRNWVNALLSLPTDIVSLEEKECIRHVLGIKPNDLLLLTSAEQEGPSDIAENYLGFSPS